MPFRKRVVRLKGRITDRLFPDHDAVQPSISDLSIAEGHLDLNSNPRVTTPQSHHKTASDSGGAQAKPILITATAQSASVGSWPSLNAFLRLLNQRPGVFGPLNTVIEKFTECIEIFARAADGREEYKRMQIELESLFEDLRQHFAHDAPPIITGSVEGLCNSIQAELSYIEAKQNRKTTRQYFEAANDLEDVLACYRRIQGSLQRLSLNANLSMWRIMDEQATNARLDRLCPALSARYNSAEAKGLKRGECTPGTRVKVLEGMHNWVSNDTPGSVYWMNGMAGTGKTTIAYSLCSQLEISHNLGASFFCSRSLPECRDVNKIVPSIAYQLSRFSHPFRYALSKVMEKEPDIHTYLLRVQFENILIKPLLEVQQTVPENLVVVLDALDECDDKEATNHILEVLLTAIDDLPIKFFVSSRPEPEIRGQMSKYGNSQARLILHELEKGAVQADIEAYVREALAPMEPVEADITALVQRAGILFIYAATAIRYIGYGGFRRNPRSRLNAIINASGPSGDGKDKEINDLYTVILEAAIDDPCLDHSDRENIRLVLNTVICAQEPLTINALTGLLNLSNTERVRSALEPLWSVLHIVETSELVTTLHASFPDYMLDSKRSKKFHCEATAHNRELAQFCFDRIKTTKPQFNICGLESSYVPDTLVVGLEERAANAISSDLFYACRYCVDHLRRAEISHALIQHIDEFLSKRLLLWMEIMNLKRCIRSGALYMKLVKEWCKKNSTKTLQLAHDAWQFVATFAFNPVSQSTPHIYVSMLPFWPTSSSISTHYARRIRPMIEPSGTAMTRQRVAELATWNIGQQVDCVAFSFINPMIALSTGTEVYTSDTFTGPNRRLFGPFKGHTNVVKHLAFSSGDRHITSYAKDGTMRVFRTYTGDIVAGHGSIATDWVWVTSVGFSPDGASIASNPKSCTVYVSDKDGVDIVTGPFQGYGDGVISAALSPDGTRMVFGNKDGTMCIVDARNGVAIVGPLKGHTNEVTSVAFPLDGTRIVSGSEDGTIFIWDAYTGMIIFGPLEGHTDRVTSVAFSPDGTRIVSGSKDETIRTWDAMTGQIDFTLLEGQADEMKPDRFLPDGTPVVSGPGGRTLSVWSARHEQATTQPPQGHDNVVTSVAFSPNGGRFASASHDRTIRLWDTQSGQMTLGPLIGHTSGVSSVKFSPDGTRLVSSSYDGTIRIWDSESDWRFLSRRVFVGHTNPVITSVSFSPNGQHIVSGSDDKTLLLWDSYSKNAEPTLGPFIGHSGSVLSVDFSLDGSHIISGSGDKTLRIWDAQSGLMVRELPIECSLTCVAFSHDGNRIASGSNDAILRVWSLQDGLLLFALRGHTWAILSVAFSPDDTRIATGSFDTTICIWDVQSQQMLGRLKGHANWVYSVAFSPDGTRLLSGSVDHSIRMWDVTTDQGSAPNSIISDWEVTEAGWLIDDQSRLLVWLPPDLRDVLMYPRTIHQISKKGYLRLNLDNARIGESWVDCYQPDESVLES